MLLTREQAMTKLKLKKSHFSKVVNGKIKSLPPLACVRIGRKQLFREESINEWIVEVEKRSCNAGPSK